MAKRKAAKKSASSRTRKTKVRDDDRITEEKLLGYFTAAYVLDVAGLLDPAKKAKLDSLVYPGCERWDVAVEGGFGITRTFVRSVYSLCTEINSPLAAVTFILRGLGCPDYEARVAEVVG